MQITLTGDMVGRVLALAKKDRKLAQAVAEHLLTTVDRGAMANFLLGEGVAVALLTERLTKDPEGVMKGLQLPAPRRDPAQRRSRRPKRRQLSAAQADKIKAEVRAFLRQHPGASHKEITTAVAFSSEGHYDRVMKELKKAGEVVQKGQKRMTRYSLKGRTK